MSQYRPLTAAVMLALAPLAQAQHEHHDVEELIVTGVRSHAPLQLITDPKRPRQPLPAHDGADYLKTIAGFSVIRKGGTDGDPILRGMAGSRLSMLVNGELILGGCNARMDPPTAYVFPETFDSIRVIKGPQTVMHGPGNSAGVVLFERNPALPQDTGWKLHSSVLAGSFGRHDEVVDLQYRSSAWELRGSASNASADNYSDGSATDIHSQYARWNGQLAAAWTPDANTRLELSTAHSDGEAAYADRGVDGSKFARENYNLKFVRSGLAGLVEGYEAQLYHNYVDHVMDNYSLRQPTGMMATRMAMNPDRTTEGGKVALTLAPSPDWQVDLGSDFQRNSHTSRNTMNQDTMPYENLARTDDGEFTQAGLFGEVAWRFADDSRVIAGLRVDRWEFNDQRNTIALSMMSTVANPTAGLTRQDTLHSGFLRVEDALGASGFTWYAGVGHNERFPDFWEITKETATALSATSSLQAERNTQFDTGLLFSSERLQGSLSVFHSTADDYLMIQSGITKAAVTMGGMPGMGMAATRSTTIVRNIDARSWGLELEGQYRLTDQWRAEFAVASVRGANDTDNTTLAQLPPLETRIGLYYGQGNWSAGVLWRSLARQDRVDPGKGNIVGQDFGPTAAADVLSFNAGWRVTDTVVLTAGIDNLLDETYAEHVSRAGAMVPGFDQITRINEPGRTAWMKAQYAF